MIGLLIVAAFVVPIAIAAVAMRVLFESNVHDAIHRRTLIVGGFIQGSKPKAMTVQTRHGAKHESPTAESGDAQPSTPISGE